VSIPRKSSGAGASQHEKGLIKFYATLYESFVRHIPYTGVGLRAIVLASPGWVRDAVFEWMVAEASRRGDKPLSKALKEKVVSVHVNSPHVHSLLEVLKSPEVSVVVFSSYMLIYFSAGHSAVEGDEVC
jgi:protein pelota